MRDEGSLVIICACNRPTTSLCAPVVICGTLLDPKFDFYILTPLTLKRRSNTCSESVSRYNNDANLVTLGQQIADRDNTHVSSFHDDLKPSKVVRVMSFLLCNQCLLVYM